MGSIVVAASSVIQRTDSVPQSSGMSMSGWVKFGGSAAGTIRYICGVRGASDGQAAAVRWSDNNFNPVAGSLGNAFSPAPSEGVWIYFALTADSAEGPRIRWWNAAGTIQDTKSDAGYQSGTATTMMIGCRPYYTGTEYIGNYAYWKSWDSVLTQANLEAEMFSPTFVNTTSGYGLTINTGFADSATDIGPNGRNWTLTSTTTDADTPPVTSGAPTPIVMTWAL